MATACARRGVLADRGVLDGGCGVFAGSARGVDSGGGGVGAVVSGAGESGAEGSGGGEDSASGEDGAEEL